MKESDRGSFFDRPLVDLFRPDWEKAAYFGLLLLAVASRFWRLGARAMSFDECTHALYSYYLYNGGGYTHDPMMHGPFLFHANALIYFLLGDNDYTARIVPALFGVFLVMSPLLLRRWLGRAGAMITSILLLISPIMLYYSRYIRDDIYMAAWMMLLTAALFHFLEERKPGWFYLGAAVLMLSLATMENAYFLGFIGLAFVGEVLLWEKTDPRYRRWLYLGGVLLSLLLLIAAYVLKRPPVEGEQAGAAASGVMKLLLALMTVVGGAIPAVLVSASLIGSRHPRPSRVADAVRSLTVRHWLVAIAAMFLIYALLFTAFFSSPIGLATGITGSLKYWLAQQDVNRGGQPWYYYLLLLAMYEFLPLLLSLAGMAYYLGRGPRPWPGRAAKVENAAQPDDLAPAPAAAAPPSDALFVAFLILWMLVSLFIYGWAGEKMPWLAVHQALPLIVLAGKFAGDLLGRVDGPAVRRGRLRPGRVALALLLVLLSLFTVRFAWMAAYIDDDYATELLVYAHGTPDVTQIMNEIADISRRTVGDKMIEVAYDQEAAWPLEWYLRQYPNRKFYGKTPTREMLNVPVVLASDDIDAHVRPFLGERYDRFKRRGLWWPNQQYMGLTWQRVGDLLTSPEKRKILWNILYWRRYPRTPDDWYHVDDVYLYIRKDVTQQVWDYSAAPPAVHP